MELEKYGESETRITRLARKPWSWPLPALLVHGGVLLFSSRIWTEIIVTHSRNGAAGEISRGARDLLMIVLLSGIYWGSPLLLLMAVGPGSGRMKTPTEAEKGCLVALIRGMMLLILYWTAWSLLREFASASPPPLP